MFKLASRTALIAAASASMVIAIPAGAADFSPRSNEARAEHVLGDMSFDHKKKRKHQRHHGDYDRGYFGSNARYYNSYDQPVYRDTRIWRGRDGQYYCQKENGTTGLLIGAGVGALAGHEIAGRGGDRTLGAILGAAGGAILGRAIDRSSTRCH